MSTLPKGQGGGGGEQPAKTQTVLRVGPPLVPRTKANPAPPPKPAELTDPPKAGRHDVEPLTDPLDAESASWDAVDVLLDNLDAGEKTQGEGRAFEKSPSGGLSNARQVFGQVGAVHLRHVRDFMMDLAAGQATIDWLALAEPAVQSIRKMAEQLALTELCRLLDDYLAALGQASEGGFAIAGEARQRLLDAYAPLDAFAPDMFSLANAKAAREGVIVRALLLQVPEVHKVALDKLFAAGITTLEAFFSARPDEIAATTGLDLQVAKAILDRFARHRAEMQGAAVDESRTFEHARLADLVVELRAHNAAYDAETGDKKRDARKAREATLLEIKVLLARIGEVELVAALDKRPFVQKALELEQYLQAKTQ